MGAFFNFDMESFRFKDLTIRLFRVHLFGTGICLRPAVPAWRSRPTCVTAKTICANSWNGRGEHRRRIVIRW